MFSSKKLLVAIFIPVIVLFSLVSLTVIDYVDLPEEETSISTETIDISNANNGTIKAHSVYSNKTKVLLRKGRTQYSYTLPEDGSEIVLPLNMGEGTYTIEICEQVEGTKYQVHETREVVVDFDNEDIPWLVPSIYCDYSPESALAQHAAALTEGLTTNKEKMDAIATWIVEKIVYDNGKAEVLSNTKDYYPKARDTYNSKSGICVDYSSLVAAMLRSVDVPTKIIVGYHQPENILHSWNQVLIDGEWISIDTSIAAQGNSNYVIDTSKYQLEKVY